MNCHPRTLAPFALLALAAVLGCGGAKVDPAEVARQRTRLTLEEEPDGAQTVLDVRAVMYGEDPEAFKAKLQLNQKDEPTEEGAEEGEEHADHDHEAVEGEHADEHEHAADDHEHAEDGHDHEHEAPAEPKVAEMDVVLVGTVGGVPNPTTQSHPDFPFAQGEAMFFLADPEAAEEFAEHGHQHAPGEECAFCAAHAADSAELLAVVQFHDEKGKLLSVDARELFDLKENKTVVVRGKAKIVPGGMMAVEATGLYVRR